MHICRNIISFTYYLRMYLALNNEYLFLEPTSSYVLQTLSIANRLCFAYYIFAQITCLSNCWMGKATFKDHEWI